METYQKLFDVYQALILIFNAGIIFRIVYLLFSELSSDPESDGKKKIKNYVKALIIINCFYGIAAIFGIYYK